MKATPSSTIAKARIVCAKVLREAGPCAAVKNMTQRYPSLRRRDVLCITDAFRINRGTASRQFYLQRGEMKK